MGFRQYINSLFMSREQVIYIAVMFVEVAVFESFGATLSYYKLGFGVRWYSFIIGLGCIMQIVNSFISADIRKKRFVFRYFKVIDLAETVFFTITEMAFLSYYLYNGMNPIKDEHSVIELMFFYSIFYRIVGSIVNIMLPSVGDVFEQSLYSNQVDYQNHSNAERMAGAFGAMLGALVSFFLGDFLKGNVYLVFLLEFFDWLGLWSRWQFYYNKKNYSIIRRRFAADSGKKLRKLGLRKK